ncbi:MAG: ROK family protein [Candidatus Doudnabacteria bacterium]|nr:ROK family protein [Candidatus Doudnabacteria bacterium]
MNIIGLDIGGTKITGAVYDGKKAVEELTIVTPKNLFEFERNIIKLVDFLSAKQKIAGVGIGMAGLVDSKSGIVRHSPNIKYIKDFNLVNLFKLNGVKKIKIDNDASCFARAELLTGQGRGSQNFLAITLGTGIGGGIVIARKLYRGSDNFGGELGHAIVGDGFFEENFKKFRDKRDFKSAGVLIGKACASFVNIFSPEAIIIGGGFGHNESKKYLPYAKREIKKYLFNEKSQVKILITQLKNPGALGAALMYH